MYLEREFEGSLVVVMTLIIDFHRDSISKSCQPLAMMENHMLKSCCCR